MAKRRVVSLFLVFLLLFVSFYTVNSVEAAESETLYNAEDIAFSPGSNETEVNFSWYSKRTSNAGLIQFAKVEKDYTGQFPVDKATEVSAAVSSASIGKSSHKVTLTGIEPSSTYMYRLGDGKGNWTEGYTFNTYSTDSYNFLLMGDPQIGSSITKRDAEGWTDTINKAVQAYPNTSFMISAGDQVNISSSESEYSGYFSPPLMKNIPIATTVGNHDNSEHYKYHFNVPNESEQYGLTAASGNYHFTHGDTLFMVLNSNNRNNEEHKEYMTKIANEHKDAKWKIVVIHHSFYSAASHSQESRIIQLRNDLVPTIDELGIDVVLAGHDHSYVRTFQMLNDVPLKNQTEDKDGRVINPKGTLYLTANSASGSKYYNLKPDTEYYSAVRQQLRVPTFTNIAVTPTSISFNTHRTDTMEVVDSYTIVKDGSIEIEKPELESISIEANSTVLPTEPSDLYEDINLTLTGKDTNGKGYNIMPSDVTYKTNNGDVLSISDRGHVTVKEDATPGTVKVWAEVTVDGKVFKSNEIDIEIVNHIETTLFSKGTEWKYLDDGSNQGKAWIERGFDDSSWKTGAAPLGYPINESRPYFGNINTLIGYGPDSKNKYATSYFRTTFEIDDLSIIGDLGYINFGIDDSVILYLNGSEIGRFNLPEGDINYNHYLKDFDGFSFVDEDRYETFLLNKEHLALLKEGENVLAAEVHQDRPSSSDVYWDMEMNVVKGDGKQEEKIGTVVTNYIDENGKEIAQANKITGLVGTTYETVQKDIPGYEFEKVEGNPTGEFAEEDITVTYVYKKVEDQTLIEGQVVTKYVDETGKEIALRTETSGEVGTDYQTEQKDLSGYTFVEVKGNPSGKYEEGMITVTYVYQKTDDSQLVEGQVVTKYVDETGKEIAERNETSGEIGTAYETVQKDIPGYEFAKVEGDQTGNYAEGIVTITYMYKKVADEQPTIEGQVVTKYVDEVGTEIAERNETSGEIGTAYETVQKDIPGYEFVKVEGNAKGDYAEGVHTVTYVYQKIVKETPILEGQVITKYVDEAGNEIGKRNETSGEIGLTYETIQKEIPGYEFVKVEGNSNGEYSEGVTTITYVYKQTEAPMFSEGIVVTKYVDEEGNEITDRNETSGETGTNYETIQKDISGYEFVKVEGNPKGEYEEGIITVTYIYKQIVAENIDGPSKKPTKPENNNLGKLENKKPNKNNQSKTNNNYTKTHENKTPKKSDKGEKSSNKPNNGTNNNQTKPNSSSMNNGVVGKSDGSNGSNNLGQTIEANTDTAVKTRVNALPNTATNIFNYIIVGVILLAIGGTILVLRKRNIQE